MYFLYPPVFFKFMPLIYPESEGLHWSIPHLLELWKTEQSKERNILYESCKLCLVFILHPISFHVAWSHCVDSTHLRIRTQPWPVWCLNQWGNQLSRPDPSGHNVPAKPAKTQKAGIWCIFRYLQYGCTFRSSKSSYWILFLGHETDRQPWIQALQPKKNKGPQNHILKFRSHRNVLRCVAVISKGGPYLLKKEMQISLWVFEMYLSWILDQIPHLFDIRIRSTTKFPPHPGSRDHIDPYWFFIYLLEIKTSVTNIILTKQNHGFIMWLVKIHSENLHFCRHSIAVTPPKAPQVDQPAMRTTNPRHLKIPSPTYPGGSNSSMGLTTFWWSNCFLTKLMKGGERNVPRIVKCTRTLVVGSSTTFVLLVLYLVFRMMFKSS